MSKQNPPRTSTVLAAHLAQPGAEGLSAFEQGLIVESRATKCA